MPGVEAQRVVREIGQLAVPGLIIDLLEVCEQAARLSIAKTVDVGGEGIGHAVYGVEVKNSIDSQAQPA